MIKKSRKKPYARTLKRLELKHKELEIDSLELNLIDTLVTRDYFLKNRAKRDIEAYKGFG